MFPISAADTYYLDDVGRVRPVRRKERERESWQDAYSFDEAMEAVVAIAIGETFPDEDLELGPEELSDLQAKRYLDIANGFYLATGIDLDRAVWRFTCQGNTFFTMRPDFAMRSLVTDLKVPPINILESAIRNRLLGYYRELDALKYAFAKGEIEPSGVYAMEWWIEFWRLRGISVAIPAREATVPVTGIDKPLKTSERHTLLTIIAALCEYSGTDLKERGTAVQIAKLTEEIGAPVSDETVRRVLRMIPDALEARRK